MTFPGVQGVRGPGWLSTTGFQIRQSRAGMTPGSDGSIRMQGQVPQQTVLDSMGSYAPAWGITAENITVMDEYAIDPHPMSHDNFEETPAEGGIDHFGVAKDNPSFYDGNADPGYTGE